MSNANKVTVAAITVIVIAGGAWLLITANKKSPEATPTDSSLTQDTPKNPEQPNEESGVGAVVVYNKDGFSPATFTIKSGQKIKILNETDSTIEFASDPHPTHTTNPEMNSEDIAPGQIKEVTVTRKGEWGFHNHYSPSKRGTMTVE